MAKSFDDSDGVWRTINGRKVFIREGQSPMDAFIRQTGIKKTHNTSEKTEETRGDRLASAYKNITEEQRQKIKDEADDWDGNLRDDEKHFEKIGNEEQKAFFEKEETSANDFYQKLDKMKSNLEELKKDPQKHFERVLGEKISKEEAEKRAGYHINMYQKSINEWEDGTKPLIARRLRMVKAYEKYLKEHPDSNMKFNEFKDMYKQ